MIDLHCHTEYSDGKGSVKNFVAAAGQKKIKIFGLSDHFSLPRGFYDATGDCTIPFHAIVPYLSDIDEIKKRTPQKNKSDFPNLILRGFEVDFIPEFQESTNKNIERLKLDYRIGSVHFVKNWPFDYSEKVFRQGLKINYNNNIKRAIGSYFDSVKFMVKSDFCDIVGHFDLIKLFNRNKSYFDESESYYKDLVKSTLKLIKKRDLILEVNSAGLDKKVKEQYPSRWILEECYNRKIPLTTGSDAHKPQDIGRYFIQIKKMLIQIGYEELVYFHKRNTKTLKIS